MSMSAPPSFEITTSRQLLAWLAEQHVSLALTTYQIGKLFSLGLKANGELAVFERTFNRCMGLCPSGDGNGFWLSSLYQIWRFQNMLGPGEQADGHDRLYVPQLSYTTGDCAIHDMGVDADGQLVFANTLFSCLATTSASHSFRPLWQPLHLTPGGGRSLPSQWPGDARWPARLCHRRQQLRCRRWLARTPP